MFTVVLNDSVAKIARDKRTSTYKKILFRKIFFQMIFLLSLEKRQSGT